MPRTTPSGSAAFKFDLAAPPNWAFAPGDTIIGNLMRHMPIVTPEATISVSLTGRVKSKIVKSSGQQKHVYRDDWRLLRPQQTLVFKGPLHLAQGSNEPLSWPFSVTIPTEQAESCRAGHKKNASFLPLDRDHPHLHILPGTFFSENMGFGPSAYCLVEYFLTAQLRYITGGDHKYLDAVLPITLRHAADPTDRRHMLRTQHCVQKIQSQRLLPGMEFADLSFKQHAQKLFHSSKVPEFHYELRFTLPEVIQLDDSAPIPVQLEVVPLLDRTSVCLKETAQTIHVNWVQAIIKQRTSVLAPSNLWDSSHSASYSESRNLNLQAAFTSLASPLDITTGKGNEPVRLGDMFQLVLRSGGLVSGNRFLNRAARIYPDLVTYSIRHSHEQRWRVSLTVAGETHVHEFNNPLKIIAEP
ncbi:uncharacterized protein N7459_000962 [Penicillium hispanicum]|uniref:uncharacterized protein n=1 Tax=Penicillium hispanicum TaxID=1080232 RepID=UPI0025406C01|nr:uncharacterized protein N7459_000962 [Penicillium hispanicum]KAJ5594754.1 hypothetical protein N7459_000962 [Penicillium hispanicum]